MLNKKLIDDYSRDNARKLFEVSENIANKDFQRLPFKVRLNGKWKLNQECAEWEYEYGGQVYYSVSHSMVRNIPLPEGSGSE